MENLNMWESLQATKIYCVAAQLTSHDVYVQQLCFEEQGMLDSLQ